MTGEWSWAFAPARERPDRGLPFPDQGRPIPVNRLLAIAPSRRPAYLEPVNPGLRADPEMQPVISRRLIAAAAEPMGDLPLAPGLDRHPGANRVAVGCLA